jgi:membrane-bound serine protease (ClpP class)
MRAVRLKAFLPVLLALGVTMPLASAAQGGPVVDVVEVSGIIDRSIASYITSAIESAPSRGAELIVLQIDSAGGVKVTPESLLVPPLVRRVRESPVPVAAWVGPRGARAGSTALFLLEAAHVAAVGPSARIGPLVPLDLGHPGREDVLTVAKVAREAGRTWTRFDPHATFGANASMRAGLADLVVPSTAELLRRLDGSTVTTAAGTTTLRLRKDEVVVRFQRPGPFARLLQTLANPSLIYLMLVAGAALLAFELFQSGFGVAGVSGAGLLAGAAYGLTVVPARAWAVALVAAGLALLTLDVALHELGPATAGGTAALVAGSLLLLPGPVLRLQAWLVVVVAALALVFFVPVMTVVRRAQRAPAGGGGRRLVGQAGEVRSVLNPEGYVWVAGARWRARAGEGERLGAGEPVIVTGLEGAVLRVARSPRRGQT